MVVLVRSHVVCIKSVFFMASGEKACAILFKRSDQTKCLSLSLLKFDFAMMPIP